MPLAPQMAMPVGMMLPSLTLDFDPQTKFNPTYLRYNKAKGRKLMRCFPQCLRSGHCGEFDSTDLPLVCCTSKLTAPLDAFTRSVDLGTSYCGRPITVVMRFASAEAKGMQLQVFGSFVEPQSTSAPQVSALFENGWLSLDNARSCCALQVGSVVPHSHGVVMTQNKQWITGTIMKTSENGIWTTAVVSFNHENKGG